MKLDKRILTGKKPLDCFDTEEAKQFIGKKCYFTRDLSRFENLDGPGVYKVTLTDISDHYEVCYGSDELGIQQWDYARFIIPCEWVKEPEGKTYRPYTLKEFIKEYSLGEEVILKRMNSNEKIRHGLFLEYIEGNPEVRLGSYWYRFEELINNYELYTNEGWKPFGIEE